MIDENNEQRGVMETHEALRMARDLGLDLVEIAPQERPPVCRIMDHGKHKYNLKKKQKNQHSHEISLKEVRLRPKTDDHDREIKMNRATRFMEQGHKVQFTMLFRGRERQHRDIAMRTFQEIADVYAETAKVERMPTFEGRRMVMVLSPIKRAGKSGGGSSNKASGGGGQASRKATSPASAPKPAVPTAGDAPAGSAPVAPAVSTPAAPTGNTPPGDAPAAPTGATPPGETTTGTAPAADTAPATPPAPAQQSSST